MSEPRTQAGRNLLSNHWLTNPYGEAREGMRHAILAIEAEAAEQHEETLRARGWQDEAEAATAAAMNFGDGMAEERAKLTPERLARALRKWGGPGHSYWRVRAFPFEATEADAAAALASTEEPRHAG